MTSVSANKLTCSTGDNSSSITFRSVVSSILLISFTNVSKFTILRFPFL